MGGNGTQFTATLNGQTVGAELGFAVKFSYAGGMSVTKYFPYVVGNNCEPDVETGLEDLFESALTLYPNPVVDIFTLETDQEMAWVELSSVTGQVVKRMKMQGTTGSVAVSDLSGGHYVVKVLFANGEVKYEKLIKY